MTNENPPASNNDSTTPDANTKKTYESPTLISHGSVEQLTQLPISLSGLGA